MSTIASLRKTPLHAVHVAAGARMVEFGGWEMPVQYTSILQEHAAVRSAAGLFDISHMGELRVKGPDAAQFLNATLTNNIDRLKKGSSQYSLLLNDQGGIVDDLFVYRIGQEEFLLIVNAAHIEEDYDLFCLLKQGNVEIRNESDEMAAFALQGPSSPKILDQWAALLLSKMEHHAIVCFNSCDASFWVARTGYTGEDGFEIICSSSHAVSAWNQILEIGKLHGLVPCGLGARDTLRMEVCYPLNGHELGPDITPLEAGLGFFVDFTKPGFHGRTALLGQKAAGISRKAVALKVKVAGPPPRAGYSVFQDGKRIGVLTSGGLSPSLQVGIGLALIEVPHAIIGNSVDIEIRGKYFSAEVVKKPIYRKSS